MTPVISLNDVRLLDIPATRTIRVHSLDGSIAPLKKVMQVFQPQGSHGPDLDTRHVSESDKLFQYETSVSSFIPRGKLLMIHLESLKQQNS